MCDFISHYAYPNPNLHTHCMPTGKILIGAPFFAEIKS